MVRVCVYDRNVRGFEFRFAILPKISTILAHLCYKMSKLVLTHVSIRYFVTLATSIFSFGNFNFFKDDMAEGRIEDTVTIYCFQIRPAVLKLQDF